MTQRGVETVLGRLATDEGLRERFGRAPVRALRELVERGGVELSPVELAAVASLDTLALRRFARALDRRLRKAVLVAPPDGEGEPA